MVKNLLLILVSLWGVVAHATPWPPALQISPGQDRTRVNLTLRDGTADKVKIYAPFGRGESGGNISESPPNVPFILPANQGGYHWFEATWQKGDMEVVATATHFFSQPGPSPTRMLAVTKHPLELIPHPLPQEHYRYRGGDVSPFLVRFLGKPLAHVKVTLTLTDGDPATFTSDDQGMVRVMLPGVHSKPETGVNPTRHGPQSPFVLSVTHHQANKSYLTTFAHTFSPPPVGNLPLGAALSMTGMVIGGWTLIRRRGVAS